MEKLDLLLRQRKLLHILLNRESPATGSELAKTLGVTARTIRSDVAAINECVAPYRARIQSSRSSGYRFDTEDRGMIQALLKAETAFFTPEDRVRYLAFRLCLSDTPLDPGEMEDEMYISRATLESDLRRLRRQFSDSAPRIRLLRQAGKLSFEQDERKRRSVLNRLFCVYWNYHDRSNAYYELDFLDESLLARVMEAVPACLLCSGIRMEDPNIVSLHFACAILLERIASGHVLPPAPLEPKADDIAARASDALVDELERPQGISVPDQERDELYQMLSAWRIRHSAQLNRQNAYRFFDREVLAMADEYLLAVQQAYGLDFVSDEDFYISLIQLIQYFHSPVRVFNEEEKAAAMREGLSAELELACLFQEIFSRYVGRALNDTELLYLANCLSGALEYLFRHHPERKLRVVIC